MTPLYQKLRYVFNIHNDKDPAFRQLSKQITLFDRLKKIRDKNN